MKTFPIITEFPRSWYPEQIDAIPWELIAPHEEQALKNHCGQSLEKLTSRGGLSACEAVAVLQDLSYRDCWPMNFMSNTDAIEKANTAIKQLKELVNRRKANE